jgi:hypothetical protein
MSEPIEFALKPGVQRGDSALPSIRFPAALSRWPSSAWPEFGFARDSNFSSV